MFYIVNLWLAIFVAIACISYMLYYFLHLVKLPMLIGANGPFRDFLLHGMPTLSSKYCPTFWCTNRYAQLVISSARSLFVPRFTYVREILELSDGGEVALDWLVRGCTDTSHCVIILPGMNCDSRTNHIRNLALAVNSIGMRVVIFNNRGTAGVAFKTPIAYCGARYEDLAEVVRHVRKSVPAQCKLSAFGISLGAFILGNYLSSARDEAHSHLTTALMLSLPFNMPKAADNLQRTILNRVLMKCMTIQLAHSFRNFKFRESLDIPKRAIACTHIIEFDTLFTAKMFGYASAADYYKDTAINADKLKRISVPLLCLNAADDPFQLLEDLTLSAFEATTHVALAITPRGSHIGFLEGCWPFRKDEFICRFFTEYLTKALIDTNGEFERISAQMYEQYLAKEHTST